MVPWGGPEQWPGNNLQRMNDGPRNKEKSRLETKRLVHNRVGKTSAGMEWVSLEVREKEALGGEKLTTVKAR